MINEVLALLKTELNAYYERKIPGLSEEKVVFIDGDKMDPITFKNNAVTPLLINVEEEPILRTADRYIRTNANGIKEKIYPDIRLNLFVLFVSRFGSYEEALKYLSLTLKFFQGKPVFDHQNSPNLVEGVDRLIMELITMPFTEQDAIWNALRTTYLPSVLYKIKMIVLRDDDRIDTGTEISETAPIIRDKL